VPELLPKEKLQPSLLDRLTDALGGIERQLVRDRERLLALLTDDEKAALQQLRDNDRRWLRPPSARDLEPFARLDADARELLERVLELEQRRVFELRQHHVISVERLRQCVLRDLSWLFNTANLECGEQLAETPGTAGYPRLDDFPAAAASVINFGIPALAGKLGSGLDLEALERRVEEAIHHFEPRLRRDSVRVRAVLEPERMQQNALTFEIEAELWGEPLPLRLLLRTIIDLEDGSATVSERAA
jgi:type VI secretion system protein ImpF